MAQWDGFHNHLPNGTVMYPEDVTPTTFAERCLSGFWHMMAIFVPLLGCITFGLLTTAPWLRFTLSVAGIMLASFVMVLCMAIARAHSVLRMKYYLRTGEKP